MVDLLLLPNGINREGNPNEEVHEQAGGQDRAVA
jgi:hypothetical protein